MFKNIKKSLVIVPMLLSTLSFALPAAVPVVFASELGAKLDATDSTYKKVSTQVEGSAATDPILVIGALINTVLGFLGLILVVFMIYGGFLWMTDNGDEKQVGNAKNVIKNSVIGAVIVVLSFVISNFVISTLATKVIN